MINFSSIGNFFRSLSYINRHTISLSKLKNRFKIMKEYSNGDLKVSSFPNMIHIEPTNHCNLQCVMCPQPRDMTRVKGTMELKMFKDIINELRNTPAEFVYLHQFGESLLVNDVYEMIDYAEDANIRAGMSTNAVALNEKNSKRLLNSKLSFLTLSLDGGKQEIYDKFRPGDSWERVEKNVFKFLDLRKKMTNEKSPFVVVQTISMKGNENSIQNLKNERRLAKFLITLFRLILLFFLVTSHVRKLTITFLYSVWYKCFFFFEINFAKSRNGSS